MEAYREEVRRRAAERDGSPGDREIMLLLHKLGVPAAAVGAAVRPDRDKEAMDWARKYWAAPEESGMRTLLLMGGPGRGKTVASAWVLAEFARRFRWNERPSGMPQREPAAFVKASGLTHIDSYEKLNQDRLEEMRRAEVLVLDDVGDEASEIGKNTLRTLVIARHDSKRKTILTSNLTREAFARHYGPALVDRIQNEGMAVELGGQSMRRKTA